MKCVLNGKNAAVLAKAIHSFARIGCELYLEADSRCGLSLRTVNMTKSSFSSILFNLDFFSSFVVKSKDSEENQCKLSMKSCLGVFRNMKQVESCTISLDTKAFKLIVQFKCRLETLRTHHISILEQETLQAAYLTDRSLNVLGGNHKLFSNIVTNFKTNEEELSIKATEKDVVVQNYADGTHVDNRFVRTQITLKPEEFESYKIGEATTITFCMRELRAILNFAESMNTSISANFDTAGKPVVFVIKDLDTFEANLVMSTLSPEDTEFECQRSRSIVQFNSQSTNNISLDKTHADDDKEPQNVNKVANDSSASSKKRNHSTTNGTDFEFGVLLMSRHSSLDVVRNKKRRTSDEHQRLPSQNGEHLSNQTENTPPPPPIDLESENIEVVFQEDSPEQISFNANMDVQDIDIDIDLDLVPEPNIDQANIRDHRPKVRQVFQRCFTGNTAPSISLGPVLAECSDEEI